MFFENVINVNIADILRDEAILIYFQPIVSIRKNSVIGLEALSRGVFHGEIVPPDTLFRLAGAEGLTVELDRLCRRKAVEAFSKQCPSGSDFLLFLNLDTSTISKDIVGSGNLLKLIREFNLNPNNVVIEINESKSSDTEALKRFTDMYRNHNFLIALDDVGAGHSNLNRLAMLKPDILKIDMMLVKNVDQEFFKQEVLKSLVSLSRKIGALVVAEGVETEEEAITTLDLGVDMLQGFYFSKPCKMESIPADLFADKREYIAAQLKHYTLDKVKSESLREEEYTAIANEIASELSKAPPDFFDSALEQMICRHPSLECLYILDESGLQASETVCNSCKLSNQKKSIFHPAFRGTDHSTKNYYYLIMASGAEKYITHPYISLASGNLCITVSKMFRDAGGRRFILCMDANFAS